jgi:hypothetical protein
LEKKGQKRKKARKKERKREQEEYKKLRERTNPTNNCLSGSRGSRPTLP